MKTLLTLLWMICATTASAQTYENRGFKALMNGKIPVEVMFQTTCNQDGEWMTAGYLYYPKAKTPAPILIVEGWHPEKPVVSKDENETVCRFTEYQPDGEVTGILYVTYVEVEGDFQMRKGIRLHNLGCKPIHFHFSGEVPVVRRQAGGMVRIALGTGVRVGLLCHEKDLSQRKLKRRTP